MKVRNTRPSFYDGIWQDKGAVYNIDPKHFSNAARTDRVGGCMEIVEATDAERKIALEADAMRGAAARNAEAKKLEKVSEPRTEIKVDADRDVSGKPKKPAAPGAGERSVLA